MPKLQDHLIGQLTHRAFDGDDHDDYTDADRNSIQIANNKIYSVKRFQVNFTTYDVRRDQDSLNPSLQCDVMVRSPETGPNAHPYWYAHVLGIFHAAVSILPMNGSKLPDISTTQVDFLWVRWYGCEPGDRAGFKYSRLPKVGFVPEGDKFAFGFLDPSAVIRGCHLIPAFTLGKTEDLLQPGIPTVARMPGEDKDWLNFYIKMYVGIFYCL